MVVKRAKKLGDREELCDALTRGATSQDEPEGSNKNTQKAINGRHEKRLESRAAPPLTQRDQARLQ